MSELRTMLEDTVSRLFRDRVTKESIEAAERGEWQADLWRAVEEGGLTRPHLAEATGGAGGSWVEAYVILRATGRYTVPLPIAETMIAGWLLEQAGIAVPEAPITVLPEPVDAAALRNDTLTATADRVPWARASSHVVFATSSKENTRVGLTRTGAATKIRYGENIAREPRDTLTFESAPVEALRPASLLPDAVRLYGAMARTAQMAGAMEALLAQAVQYAGERVQFGRPIAKFQVIQHELAKLAGDVAACGVAAEAAFHAAARRAKTSPALPNPRFEIAVAKTRVGDSVQQATGIAHQVHGAIGFTYEHGLHFATRRLWAWRAEFGTDTYWAAEIGREAIARGADFIWTYLTSRSYPTS